MKKILSLVLALAMMLSLCSFASAEGFDGEIKVWVAEATVEFTKAQVEAFKAANPEYANNVLGWKAVETLDDTLASAWKWQVKLREKGIM